MLDRMLRMAPKRQSEPGADRAASRRAKPARPGTRRHGETDDGLEAGICFINPEARKMIFAGARFSLWRANEKGVIEIKGDRKGVGYRRYPQETNYTDITLPFDGSDTFYLTTDGLIDQIGGPRGRSFGKRRFQELLKKNQGMPMSEQEEALRRTLASISGPADPPRRPHRAGFRPARLRGRRCSRPNSWTLRAHAAKQGIIFAYSGYMTEPVLSGVGEALKQKLTIDDADTKTLRSVFAVFVEQMQNIIRYSAEKAQAALPPASRRQRAHGNPLRHPHHRSGGRRLRGLRRQSRRARRRGPAARAAQPASGK